MGTLSLASAMGNVFENVFFYHTPDAYVDTSLSLAHQGSIRFHHDLCLNLKTNCDALDGLLGSGKWIR